MDVLMMAQYFGNIEQLAQSNNRFVYLAELLAQEHSVEVLTTSFVHAKKKQGKGIPEVFRGFRITALSEPGYPKNVCLQRFYSHRVLADRMEEYLRARTKPDVIYCAVPSLDCAGVVARYAKRNGISLILDIQDLWPEAFKMVFRVTVVKDILFFPMSKKADHIYSCADHIIGVSKTYCDRAKGANPKAPATPVFIGTNLDTFDNNAKANMVARQDDKLVLGYCGTLGHSYDLRCVFDAMQLVRSRGYDNVELWIMGRGPLADTFQSYAEERKVNAKFLGWMPYEQMCGVLSSCNVCVNPISRGAAQSIINKHADYAACGLPVINTQESEEYRTLVDTWQCGINCGCADPQSVADAIIYMAEHESQRKQMGKNARKMAQALFDRKNTYAQILEIVQSMATGEGKIRGSSM